MLAMILTMLLEWKRVFAQERTAYRAMRQALSSVCVLGRRTIARSYLVRQDEGDWSGEYKLHARSPWEAQELFEPMLKEAMALCGGTFLPLGCDDTRIRKTGKKIPSAQWGRDPLSPPFHVNLQYGVRYLHASVLLPLHQRYGVSARAVPVAFEEAPPVKKPGKKATPEQKRAYRQASREKTLSTQAVALFQALRQRVDDAGGGDKILAWAVDGSFCNRTVFTAQLARTILIARTRKDAKLCFPALSGRRLYSPEKFTPEQVRQDENRPWQQAEIFHGGKWRRVDYKEVNHVLWQRGAGTRHVRLLVVRPIPYRKTKQGRLLYRQPAFLLTTDTETPAVQLLQMYFDRWQLEVAHRELKDNFGVGQAQVRAPRSVARQPALQVATYSAIHLAALNAFGPQRPDQWAPLPPYQREQARVSCLDLIRQIRHEVLHNPDLLPFDLNITEKSLLQAATT
jgi:hypothetical protein